MRIPHYRVLPVEAFWMKKNCTRGCFFIFSFLPILLETAKKATELWWKNWRKGSYHGTTKKKAHIKVLITSWICLWPSLLFQQEHGLGCQNFCEDLKIHWSGPSRISYRLVWLLSQKLDIQSHLFSPKLKSCSLGVGLKVRLWTADEYVLCRNTWIMAKTHSNQNDQMTDSKY